MTNLELQLLLVRWLTLIKPPDVDLGRDRYWYMTVPCDSLGEKYREEVYTYLEMDYA